MTGSLRVCEVVPPSDEELDAGKGETIYRECIGDPELISVPPPSELATRFAFVAPHYYPATHLVLVRKRTVAGTFADARSTARASSRAGSRLTALAPTRPSRSRCREATTSPRSILVVRAGSARTPSRAMAPSAVTFGVGATPAPIVPLQKRTGAPAATALRSTGLIPTRSSGDALCREVGLIDKELRALHWARCVHFGSLRGGVHRELASTRDGPEGALGARTGARAA